jgi:opacity protein-like surface antigen
LAHKDITMHALNKTLLALAFLGSSTALQANDSVRNFASVTLGNTSDKIQHSRALNDNLNRPNTDGIIGKDTTWGVRLGQQTNANRYYATYDNVSGSHNGLKLRHENLLGSYDMFVPVGWSGNTQLFGGGTLGMTKLSHESSGMSRGTDWGYAYGAQAGVMHNLSQNTSMELGYRYLRGNAGHEVSSHGGPKQGSLSLNSSAQTYLAANFLF